MIACLLWRRMTLKCRKALPEQLPVELQGLRDLLEAGLSGEA